MRGSNDLRSCQIRSNPASRNAWQASAIDRELGSLTEVIVNQAHELWNAQALVHGCGGSCQKGWWWVESTPAWSMISVVMPQRGQGLGFLIRMFDSECSMQLVLQLGFIGPSFNEARFSHKSRWNNRQNLSTCKSPLWSQCLCY
jgi:hypothetical protein